MISGACAHNRPDALRVVGLEKAALLLAEHGVEDLRFGQRLADPIAGIGHAGEHRSIAVGHDHDGALRKLDVRERRCEPVQVLYHEDDSVDLSRRADQRIGIADCGKLRDATDLIIADGEVVHLERHLEVRSIRDIDGRRKGSALHTMPPLGSATAMFKYSGYAFSISARNALHAAASFVWICGIRANAVNN